MAELSLEEKSRLFERMSLMLDNSMSSTEVFEYCAEEFSNIERKLKICADLVIDGMSMVKAMNSVKLLSSTESTTLLGAEVAGDLPNALNSLAEYCETQARQIRQVIAKTVPNVAYLVLAFAVLYGLMLLVVPMFGQNLPAHKRAGMFVFKLSNFIQEFHEYFAMYALCGVLVGCVWLVRFLSSASGRKTILDILLVTPYVKKGVISFILGLWSKQAASMLKSGVSFNEVVDLTKDALPGKLSFGLSYTRDEVQRVGWSTALDKSSWHQLDIRRTWPPEIWGALKAGGDTGRLDLTLSNLSASLLRTSDRIISVSTETFSKVTFLIAAAAVGGVVVSVLFAMVAGISK